MVSLAWSAGRGYASSGGEDSANLFFSPLSDGRQGTASTLDSSIHMREPRPLHKLDSLNTSTYSFSTLSIIPAIDAYAE